MLRGRRRRLFTQHALLFQACTARNCYPSPLNYYNFPKSCCTSVNEVICHGIPDRRLLQEGDILNSTLLIFSCHILVKFVLRISVAHYISTVIVRAVDITVYHNGFHGDLNETFFVGDVDEEAKKLVQTTYECLMQAIDSGRNFCVTACLRPPRCSLYIYHHKSMSMVEVTAEV